MFFPLKFLLFESGERTFPCWLNTLSIATRGKPVRELRPSTRRLSDCLSHIIGPETYANYRTLSNDPSSCVKPRIFRWMKAGCPNSLRTKKRRASFISPRRWQHKKRKSSKGLCEKATDGSSDRRVPPQSLASRGPRLNPKFGHSRSTRIALGLFRELKGSRLLTNYS